MGSSFVKLESKYYYIGEMLGKFEVLHAIFMDDSTDQNRKESHNMFMQEMDARKILDGINKVLERSK